METALLVKSAVIRALRTFFQVLLAFLAANITEVTSVEAARVIAVAAFAAALAAAWRAFLDQSPIPSLVDPAPAEAEPEPSIRATSGDGLGRMTRGPDPL